jgi:hypothetical protein
MWIFEALQATALATFVRESPSMLGYTAFLSLHAMGLAIAVGLSATVSLRLLGVAKSLPLYPMRRVYPWIWFGLIVNALSGFGLFAAAATTLVTSVMFLLKMAFVVLAAVAAWYTGRLAFAAGSAADDVAVSGRVRVFAAATLFLWFAAVVTGRLTGYPYLVRAYLGV